MPNPNHDAKGQFSSGGDSGSHGTGVTHTGNAGISDEHRVAAAGIAKNLRMNMGADALAYAKEARGRSAAMGTHEKTMTYNHVISILESK